MRRALIVCVALLLLTSACSRPARSGQPAPIPGRIAFVRGGDLWMWEAGREQRMTEGGGVRSPRLSRDGRYVAFHRDTALWVVLPGRAPRKVGDADSTANWSPRKNHLVYTNNLEVFTVAVTDDGPSTPALVAKGWTQPAWSPDGRLLALARNTQREDFTGTAEVGVVDASGGEPRVLWQGEYLQKEWVGPVRELKWSADGQWLAFYRGGLTASLSADQNQLNVLPVGGGGVTPLAAGPVNRAYFQWAPQGATLAFTDGVGRFAWGDKNLKLAKMPPTASLSSPTPAGYADREPAWDPDSKQVYFIRSVAKAPEKMFQPAAEQAIWRLTLATGQQQAVAGTDGALGVRAAAKGQLLWPKGDGKRASLWTESQGAPVQVLGDVDFASWYYGQFYWDAIYDWWAGERP